MSRRNPRQTTPTPPQPAKPRDGTNTPPSTLHTPADAAKVLTVNESWLRRKASQRTIPCTFVGRHLRFTDEDLNEIIRNGHSHTSPHQAT